ncbi:MAG: YihY/virulence factor BrkB family protein [Deltaproteobacteria bacterium]|jgi:membrane protein|nr:YihY/virulence factor BrkB family protein [Deltaproteobacteria bacterium]
MKNPIDKILEIYDRLDRSGVTNWPLLAAALSFYTALAAVPVLAICFAVARSLGLEEALNSALRDNFAGQEQVLQILTSFAENLIRNFSGSLLVFTALAFIFWSVYGLLWQLEVNFSKIFGYLSDRQAIHRATDYLTIMLVIPIFLMAAGSTNVFVTGIEATVNARLRIGLKLEPLAAAAMKVLPFLVWWLVLTWTYAYFSRGIARWKERLLGGFSAGLVFQLFQKVYLKVIFAVTSYNAIYGTFAAVPLFLIWLYISWLIVIAGGELTRRLTDYFLTGLPLVRILDPMSYARLKELALRAMDLSLERFGAGPGSKPLGLNEMARALNAPVPYTGRAVNCLMRCGLLVRVAAPDSENGPEFLPGAAPECLTPEIIVGRLELLDKF